VFLNSGGQTSGYWATLTYNLAFFNGSGLYSQFPTTRSPNYAFGDKVLDCYNVTCTLWPFWP
jgi:hypothetical protein